MIELTVKTLDSKNHTFSVPDDTTVKQFKEQIADSVNISADSQRLIYCGRVLQDEKNLSEYDVNGKVIHLVQRAPPSSNGSGPDRGGTSTRSGSNANVRRSPFRLFTPNNASVPSNAMYLGAVAFPGEIMDAAGMSMQQPRQCLSQSRLNIVRIMLRRSSAVLTRLENNSQESADTSPDSGNGSSETNAEEEDVASGGALYAATVEITPPAFVVDNGQRITVDNGTSVEIEVRTSPQQPTSTTSESEPRPPQPTSEQQAPSNEGEGEGNNASSRYPRTRALADLLDRAAEVNTRVQPFLSQYQQLMRDDPSFSDQTAVSTNQRLFSSVSEIMHNLAHAYHALSDIMCDFSQPPPRFLRCRPVLIHHSAVVQTGIPIQVATSFTTSANSGVPVDTANLNAARAMWGAAATASAPSTTSTSPAPTEEASQPPQQPAPVAQPEEETSTPTPAQPDTSATATAAHTTQQQSSSATTASRGARLGPVVGTGTGFEIFVDVAPGSITIDSVEAAVVTNAPTNSASDGNPWQNPPEFVQNLISALAGQFMGATVQQFRFPDPTNASSTSSTGTNTNTNSTSTTAGSNSSSSSQQPAAPSSTQNSQARGNTATHPTTATQTRSTARPHVHLSPGSLHGLTRNNFDPFLPCNSHHIRNNRGGRQRANSFHATNTNGANSATETPNPRVPQMSGSGSISISVQAEPMTNREPQTSRATATAQQDLPPEIESLLRALHRAHPAPEHMTGRHYSTTVGELFQAMQSGQPYVTLQPANTADQNPTSTRQNSTTAGQNPTTLAQMLESVPGYSYTPGESIITDVFMILAQCLSFMDMIQLGMGGSECLVRARPQLRQLISQRLLNNQRFTISAITQIVDRFNAELRPYYSVFENARMREEVDLPASISLYNHSMLPRILNTVMKEDHSTFHRTLITKCTQYVRQLCALLQYCCLDGVSGLETVLRALVTQMNANVPGVLQEWTMNHSIRNFRTFLSTLNIPVDDVKRFLVYRMGNPNSSTQPDSTSPITPAPEPMDILVAEEIQIESTPNPIREPPVADVPPTQHINEAIGWQGALPSEWVPIITRDSQRQRRQSSQGPFSDAYLSGMPSKRRKLITSSKPQGNLSQVISDSMTTALGAAGMSSGPEVDVIAQRAGQDETLRTAYREQVRTTLCHNLNSNPDYLPEKYPNTAKYFKKP